ncbi:hypothetical protein AWZ03_011513 [Drosophila navojoa]|uniref:Uncharacterized protein n=1 Tax=Drosophila navojoa TaxID=7232 RepID=A0A484AZY4_DRONA|nr:uncharacterized protein LOC115564195 [Drosophila navojoa]TDG42056.1 hypothetical protein AWZ03_011513 [Drosophila navojoa]
MNTQANENPDNGTAVPLDLGVNECGPATPKNIANPKNIGWNLKVTSADPQSTAPTVRPPSTGAMQAASTFLTEVQVSHKQITDRFVELLNLFEDYSKIMKESEQATQPKLMRTQSEQFTTTHFQPEDSDCSDQVKTSVSLNRMQLSESTLRCTRPKFFCEMASQTHWSDPIEQEKLLKPQKIEKLEKKEPQQPHEQQLLQTQSHTLHIEVESINSATALQRAPLRQRLWQVLYEAGQTLIACLAMMGENFTYVLFVLLCLWCLYLIIAHYYSFLEGNMGQQTTVKHPLSRIHS